MKDNVKWGIIPNISGYLISEYGVLIRLQNYIDQKNRFGNVVTRDRKLHIVKTRISYMGYLRAAICFGGAKRKDFTVHRLVALAFIPNPNNYDQINHRDGNKLNNHFSNLEWCDASHNIRHAIRTGLLVTPSSWADTQSKPISLYFGNKEIWVFGSIGEASRLTKVKRETISKSCRSGKLIYRGPAVGHKFNYYEFKNAS